MAVKDVLQSFMLTELFKGLALTGRHFLSRTITVQFPGSAATAASSPRETAR